VPFAKGQSGYPKGRPKDNTWASLRYWFDLLNNDLKNPKLKIGEKVRAELKCIELILAKRNLPNESTEDSISNAADALRLIKDLEINTMTKPEVLNVPEPISESRSDSNSVDSGAPSVQAEPNPKVD
jgi:hypothetical protein